MHSDNSHLKKGVVGFPTALATAVGLIIAGPVLLTATTGFGIGGTTFALAMLVAYFLMLAQVASFSEAAGMIPTAGSLYDYLSCGLGRFFGITGTLSAYLIVHVFAGTAEVAVAGVFATVNFGFMSGLTESGSWIVGVSIVLLLGWVNILGVEVYGKIEIAMTGFMWLTLILFGIAGLILPTDLIVDQLFGESIVGTDFISVLSLVGLALFLFVGCEMVTPLAAELKTPERNIPRAMFIGVTGVAIAMMLYGAAIKKQIGDVELGDGSGMLLLETPDAIPIFATQVMGTIGQIWLGLAVLLASAATLNTLLAGLPRILYGMAIDGSLPGIFSYLHPKYKTPITGIVVTMAIPAIGAIIINGNIESILHMVLASVCAWLVSYILVNLSIIALRIRRPDLHRPFKSPFYPFTQVLAIIGMLIAIWFITPPGMTQADIYVPFAILMSLTAIYALVWTLAVKKINPFKPLEPETVIEKELGEQAGLNETKSQ